MQQTVIVRERARPVFPPDDYGPVRQTAYLIAFKNSVVRVADQYWVSGATLFYLTPDHQRMSAPLDTVDRTLSVRLNSEQNVAFDLPAGSTVPARTRLVRHTATVVHKQCFCTAVGASSRASGGQASRAGSPKRGSK
jgi:hypothetical protein